MNLIQLANMIIQLTRNLQMQIAKIVIFIIALLTITTNLYDDAQMTTHNTPADIIIYSKDYCPYCVKAKQLLESKDLK